MTQVRLRSLLLWLVVAAVVGALGGCSKFPEEQENNAELSDQIRTDYGFRLIGRNEYKALLENYFLGSRGDVDPEAVFSIPNISWERRPERYSTLDEHSETVAVGRVDLRENVPCRVRIETQTRPLPSVDFISRKQREEVAGNSVLYVVTVGCHPFGLTS